MDMLIEDVFPHVQNLLHETKDKSHRALLQITEMDNRLIDVQDALG